MDLVLSSCSQPSLVRKGRDHYNSLTDLVRGTMSGSIPDRASGTVSMDRSSWYPPSSVRTDIHLDYRWCKYRRVSSFWFDGHPFISNRINIVTELRDEDSTLETVPTVRGRRWYEGEQDPPPDRLHPSDDHHVVYYGTRFVCTSCHKYRRQMGHPVRPRVVPATHVDGSRRRVQLVRTSLSRGPSEVTTLHTPDLRRPSKES